MAVLTVVDASITGASSIPTVAVTAAGDSFANDGRTFVIIKNSSGANAYTVATTTPATAYGQAIADGSTSVGTSASVLFGPFPTAAFNDSGGAVALAYTGTAPATDLTVKVFSLP